MKYNANFVKSKKGNAIKTGKTLICKVTDARIVSGWLAKKTWYGKKLLQIDQGKNSLKFKLVKKKGGKTVNYETGTYIVKLSAFCKCNKNQQWTDVFEVI